MSSGPLADCSMCAADVGVFGPVLLAAAIIVDDAPPGITPFTRTPVPHTGDSELRRLDESARLAARLLLDEDANSFSSSFLNSRSISFGLGRPF